DERLGVHAHGGEEHLAAPPFVDAHRFESELVDVPGERTLDVGAVDHDVIEADDLHEPRRYRGNPRMRSPMIVFCTSDVPPAIDAAWHHTPCRGRKPPPGLSVAFHHSGAARPAPSSARAESAWVMSVHASLVTLDSGPGSMPFASRDSVRQLCRRSTRSSTND